MQLVFEFGGDMVIVKIKDREVKFATSDTNFQQFVPIDNLKLDIQGILKEFPDLKGKPDREIRKEAVKRFKEKLDNLGGDMEIKDYVIKELRSRGYVLR